MPQENLRHFDTFYFFFYAASEWEFFVRMQS